MFYKMFLNIISFKYKYMETNNLFYYQKNIGTKNYYKLLIFSFIFFIFSFNCTSQTNYYWSNNRKIFLNENKSSIIINFTEIQSELQKLKTISASYIKSFTIDSVDKCVLINFNTFQQQDINKVIKNLAVPMEKIKSASFSLTNKEGDFLWLTNRIVLKLKKGNGLQSIRNIMNDYGMFLYKSSYDMVILEVSEITNTLLASNNLYKSDFVEWCHPDFIAIPVKFDDPLYQYQYYLNNSGQFGGTNDIDINAPEAWMITKGCSDIVVAVIGKGVEEHEELTGRVLSGYTAGVPSGIGAPINSEDGHGESCAGIIAASHNEIGIKGIAPNVKILPINIFSTSLTSEIAASINWAWQNGADVLSNSWGYSCSAYFDDIADAITNARTKGRHGNGSIVVFSAGNNSNDCVTFPANVSGVIAVGAIDKSGQLWDYSAHGNRLNVVAPSGACNLEGDVYTIDRMGNDGYNPFLTSDDLLNTNYTSKFGGTSAACPEVSGVVALMLSVNPDLTEQQVNNIIKISVTDMGMNGKDYYFGYGRIDASRALFESIILQESSCQYTKGDLNLTCINNNKEITFLKSPKTGIAAGTYFAEEYIADATIDFSTPFAWYEGKGLSGANPNNGNYYLIKNDNGSSIYFKTWFYYIKNDEIGNSIEQWVPDDPYNINTRNYVAAPPESLKLKNMVVNIDESKNYRANNYIVVAGNDSYFVVEGNGTGGGNSILKAGISITLSSGFNAKAGSCFHSYIEPNCLTSSNFCSNTQQMLFNNKPENKLYTTTGSNIIFTPLEKNITINDKNIELGFTIFPNPNNGLFSIVLNNNESRINSIEIYNLTGDQVLNKNGLNSNIVKLNIPSFPKGIYFVRIYSNNKTYFSKIICE